MSDREERHSPSADHGRPGTTGQASLLRGINVGGRVKVAMADVRAIYEALGVLDVRTHLQSGNVVFRSDRPPAELSALAETALRRDLGLAIRVLGRTHADLARIAAGDPFPDSDPSRHVVVFLSGAPPIELIRRLEAAATAGEQVRSGESELHIDYPAGQGRSNLTGALIERTGLVATARNWRTVTRLLELTAAPT